MRLRFALGNLLWRRKTVGCWAWRAFLRDLRSRPLVDTGPNCRCVLLTKDAKDITEYPGEPR